MKGPLAEIHNRLMGVLRGVTLAELFAAPTVTQPLLTLLNLSVPAPLSTPA
jgi:hypothetical protein